MSPPADDANLLGPLVIRVRLPDGEVFERRLPAGGELSIGRSARSDIQVRDESLSRRHAVLSFHAGRPSVRDLGSRNGTYVNGLAAAGEQGLDAGDRVQLGGCELEVAYARRVRLTDRRASPSDATAVLDVTRLRAPRPVDVLPDRGDESRGLSLVGLASRELLAHGPLPEILARILDLLLETLGAERAAVALLDGPDAEPTVALARGPEGTIDLPLSRTVARAVLSERRAVSVVDVEEDPVLGTADSVVMQGVRSLMCAPLWDGQHVRGLLYVDRRVARGGYVETDLKVLAMLANVLAVKIENARLLEDQLARQRLEEELATARSIQERLLPRGGVTAHGMRVHGVCRACHEIGGDFYDVQVLPTGRCGLVVADVCGKGVAAALLAASLQAAVRAGLPTPGSVGDRLERLNAFLHEHSPSDRFATAAHVELDPVTGELWHAVAGHPPPLVLRADGRRESLTEGGMPLGIFGDATYEEGRTVLHPGDRVLLYTDGITEAAPEGRRHEAFGLERLADAVSAEPEPGRACSAAFARLSAFTGGTPLRDDATVVLAARTS